VSQSGSRPPPTAYRLRVEGHLGDHWGSYFDGFTTTHESDGTTTLTGEVEDQAQLHGLLARVRDLGVTLLSVDVHPPHARSSG
jgi:hypothetical protein